MRASGIHGKLAFYLDLYNPYIKKNIELHYSTNSRKYNKNLLDSMLHYKIVCGDMLTLHEWDMTIERCVKQC